MDFCCDSGRNSTQTNKQRSARKGAPAERAPEIRLLTDAEWPEIDPKSVVHLKGFTNRINFGHIHPAAAAEKLVTWVVEKKPLVVVWDGDPYSEDSFTILLPWIQERCNVENGIHVQLAAFVREADTKALEESWSASELEIDAYMVNEEITGVHEDEGAWAKLGAHALQTTRSNTVGCLGGGRTTLQEWEAAVADEGAEPDWALSPIVRAPLKEAADQAYEHSQLAKVKHARLKILIPEFSIATVMNNFYDTRKNAKHSVARGPHPDYPQEGKPEVPVDKVPWDVKWPEYKPLEFTSYETSSEEKPFWADPEDPKDENCQMNENRILKEGFDLDEATRRPLNPAGRTGKSGRGGLGKWGSNFAADPLVTRYNCETGRLQIVVIRRNDTQEWAMPGGMVDPGETVSLTARREFAEEAGNHEGEDKVKFEELVKELFSRANGKILYHGYVDDPRNTDNSWMETAAMHYHCKPQLASMLNTKAGDDADDVKWLDIQEDGSVENLYANHSCFVKAASEECKKLKLNKPEKSCTIL